MRTRIERHPFPVRQEVEEFQRMKADIHAQQISQSPDYPRSIGGTFDSVLISAKSRCIEDPDAALFDTWETVVTAMQLGSALFAVAMASEGEVVSCRIGHEEYRIPGTGPTSHADAGSWLDAFWLAVVCREQERMTRLCQVPVSLLRASGAEYDEYIYHWVDALQTYWLESPGLGEKLAAAYQGSLPERLRVAPAELILKIMSGPIDLFYRFLSRDAEAFNASLVQALELHREFWTADEERVEQNVDGAFALGPLAVTCLAYDAGRPVTVESSYLPEHLVKRSWVGEFPT